MTEEDTAMTHMQLDGEPWPQIIPAGDKTPLMVSIHNWAQHSRCMLMPRIMRRGAEY